MHQFRFLVSFNENLLSFRAYYCGFLQFDNFQIIRNSCSFESTRAGRVLFYLAVDVK